MEDKIIVGSNRVGRFEMMNEALTNAGHTIVRSGEESKIGKLDREKIQKQIRGTLITIDRKLMARKHDPKIKAEIKKIITDKLEDMRRNYSTLLQDHVAAYISEAIDEILGYGPIQPLIDDPEVSDIFVNGPGPENIWYEKNGKTYPADEDMFYDSDEQVMNVIEVIVGPIGRRIDESSPRVDARLPDGSRFHATIPPIAINGPEFEIRKFKTGMSIEDLVEKYNSITWEVADFLKAGVTARLNIVVSGGTGSGKTSTLNVISSFIKQGERIITVEDSAELQIKAANIVRLETKEANAEGKGAITIRHLVKEALRMKPQRIIVGEIRGAEALDMLQAMNTGHDGSLTTGHSNSAKDMLSRIETMVLMAGEGFPLRAVRGQIASAVDMIMHQEQLDNGSRRVVEIISIEGMNERDEIETKQLMVYDRKLDKLMPTKEVPRFIHKFAKTDFKSQGVTLPKWAVEWIRKKI